MCSNDKALKWRSPDTIDEPGLYVLALDITNDYDGSAVTTTGRWDGSDMEMDDFHVGGEDVTAIFGPLPAPPEKP